jgi:hypothetical protein
MATIEVQQCDRCKKLSTQEPIGVCLTVVGGGDPDDVDHDLCASCADGVRAYLDGAKLARVRRPAESE